jgi:hypothetical protein
VVGPCGHFFEADEYDMVGRRGRGRGIGLGRQAHGPLGGREARGWRRRRVPGRRAISGVPLPAPPLQLARPRSAPSPCAPIPAGSAGARLRALLAGARGGGGRRGGVERRQRQLGGVSAAPVATPLGHFICSRAAATSCSRGVVCCRVSSAAGMRAPLERNRRTARAIVTRESWGRARGAAAAAGWDCGLNAGGLGRFFLLYSGAPAPCELVRAVWRRRDSMCIDVGGVPPGRARTGKKGRGEGNETTRSHRSLRAPRIGRRGLRTTSGAK